MKHLIVALFTAATVAVSAANETTVASTNDITVTANETIVTANATLKDGSTVKGEFLAQKITGSTAFANQLALDPAIVKAVSFTWTNGESKVELKNGDKFAMTVVNESFKIKSLLGELAIPRNNFRSLSLSARKAAAGGSEDGLVFYCTFDDEASVLSPTVGPKGIFLQGKFNDGKVGNALLTTVYAQNAAFTLPKGFFNTAGCIEFWAKIQNPSPYIGSGGDPRLFTIIQKPTNNTICTIDIVSNNGAGNSGFSTWTFLGNMASIRGMRHLRYEDIFPGSNPRDWHHYAVVWDKDGIGNLAGNPQKALFVDGKYIPDIQEHIKSSNEVASTLSSPTLLSFTHDPSLDPELATKSPFLIDEFKIWNYAKTDFDL